MQQAPQATQPAPQPETVPNSPAPQPKGREQEPQEPQTLPGQAAEKPEAAAPDSANSPKPPDGTNSAEAPDGIKSPEVLQDIWKDVCQEAASNQPILNILYDSVPISQKGEDIKLLVGLKMAKDIVEKNATYINGLIRRFGVDGHIVCVLDNGGDAVTDDAEDAEEKARRETQKAASQLLGIDVKLG